jgi:LysM repeat protein
MFARIVILTVAVALGVAVVAHRSDGAAHEATYVVQPADTLWTIAQTHYAGDVRKGVWQIQKRNHLASPMLRPGQALVIPVD